MAINGQTHHNVANQNGVYLLINKESLQATVYWNKNK